MLSVMDYAQDQVRWDANAASLPSLLTPQQILEAEGVDDSVIGLEIKRRHRNRLIKQILKDAGYGDLAKMVKIKSERV